MIELNNISDINDKSDEGKLLIAAIAVLTSINEKHLTDPLTKQVFDGYKWGDRVHPDTALQQVVDLANNIYHTEEYKRYQKILNRDNKIDNILTH